MSAAPVTLAAYGPSQYRHVFLLSLIDETIRCFVSPMFESAYGETKRSGVEFVSVIDRLQERPEWNCRYSRCNR